MASVAEQPPLLIVTLYVPLVETFNVWEVAAVFHRCVALGVPASSRTLAPWQIVVSLPRFTVSVGASVTTASNIAVHCCGVVTCTVYVPLVVGVMLWVVALLLQR